MRKCCKYIILTLISMLSFSYSDQDDKIIFNHSFHIEDVELDCEECHDGVGSFDKLSFSVFPEMDLCLDCHDGDTAEDDCEKCHTNADDPLATSDSWIVSGNIFSHKMHFNYINDCEECHGYIIDDDGSEGQKIWIEQECNECHSKHEYTNSMTECINCHTDIHKGNNDQDCQLCHTPGSWESINAVEIHQTTRFPLIGPHMFADCIDCHTSTSFIDFEPLNVDCYTCHSQDYLTTQVPNHSINNISHDCEECHMMTAYSWDLSYTEHSFFPLVGGHLETTCYECHTNSTLQDIDPDCYSCHQNDYNSTNDPNHFSLGVSTDCDECHTTNQGWSPVNINHDLFFLLTGAHVAVKNDCQLCHSAGFMSTSDECYTCHRSDYESTIDPNHVQFGFSTDCETCHSTGPNWSNINFDHSAFFPLSGAHNFIQNDCDRCHSTGYDLDEGDCYYCHSSDYHTTNEPNHVQYQFPQECDMCHSTNIGWEPIILDHNTVFPLTGAHTSVDDCIQCHQYGFENISDDCSQCHLANYSGTTDPNHDVEQFPTDCSLCHTTNPGWSPIIFDHSSVFVLTGAHSLIQNDCNQCHSSGYVSLDHDCSNCHLEDYNSVIDPSHINNNFDFDCSECHSTNAGWELANFDHNTIYTLTGSHALIQNNCTQCHSTGYNGTSSDCANCHLIDYNSTGIPNHANNQFPTDCEECHSTGPGWTPSIFDHGSVFSLTGAHSTIQDDCIQCHASGYTNQSSACASCHLSDYNSTSNPNHANEQFSQNCSECHSTSPGWSPIIFDHNTVFTFTGTHTSIQDDCSRCHSTGYSNIGSDCSDCHLADYNGTTDPNHSTNQFPTDCDECHSTNAGWSPVIFDHNTVFALTGAHSLIQDNCIQCHVSGYSNTSGACSSCHLSDYNSATDPNHSAAQFSTDCSQCHSTGPGWTPSTFDHNTVFALTGAHNTIASDCAQCHSSGYSNTSSECSSCHLSDYNGTTDPNHSTNQFPTDCSQCHTTNPGWSPATFDHNLVFALTGAHSTIQDDCIQCHSSGYSGTSSECSSCHIDDYNSATDPNHSAAQFPTDCSQCHTTNPGWTPSTFDHDGAYFPIYSGDHRWKWDNCSTCHTNSSNYAEFTCFNCHFHNENNMRNRHTGVDGYFYNSYSCYDCHPNGDD